MLNNVTIEEVTVLKLWDENGLFSRNSRYKEYHYIFTAHDLGNVALNIRKNGDTLGEYEKYILDLSKNKDRVNQIILSLGYKDLLYVVSDNNFGSGEEAKTRGTTEFGKIFLKFIK